MKKTLFRPLRGSSSILPGRRGQRTNIKRCGQRTNIKLDLSLPDSGRLRFQLNIWTPASVLGWLSAARGRSKSDRRGFNAQCFLVWFGRAGPNQRKTNRGVSRVRARAVRPFCEYRDVRLWTNRSHSDVCVFLVSSRATVFFLVQDGPRCPLRRCKWGSWAGR